MYRNSHDRVARVFAERARDIAERLDKAGADFVSLSKKLDTTSAAGKMMFRLLAVLAKFERDLVGERTRAAMQHKKANGQRVGTVPCGYDLSDDEISLVENPSELAIIGDIKAMRRKGKTLVGIADSLTKRKIKTKKGNRRWSNQSIAVILKR